MMRGLLLAAVTVALCSSFPMCTDGESPLMEQNDAFPCGKGCPLGFVCEYQDRQYTVSTGICCANMTALKQLYGDDNGDHVDPIWDLAGLAATSLDLQGPSGQDQTTHAVASNYHHVVSAPAFGPPPRGAMAGDQTTAEYEEEGDQNTVQSKEEIDQSNDELDSDGLTAMSSREQGDRTADEQTSEKQTSEGPEVDEDSRTMSSKEEGSQILNGETESEENLKIRVVDVQTTTESMDLTKEDDTTTVVEDENSAPPTEASAESASTSERVPSPMEQDQSTKSSESTESDAGQNTDKEEASTSGSTSSVAELNQESDKATNLTVPTTESDKHDVIVTASGGESVRESESTAAAADESSDKISMEGGEIVGDGEGAEKETDGETQLEYSCLRQKYQFSCHGGAKKTQPTIRWYWNSEKMECEFYPWGYCPGDRIVHATSIRTKADCELHCSADVGISQRKAGESTVAEEQRPVSTDQNENDIQNLLAISDPTSDIASEVGTNEYKPEVAVADPKAESSNGLEDTVDSGADPAPATMPELAKEDPVSEGLSALHEIQLLNSSTNNTVATHDDDNASPLFAANSSAFDHLLTGDNSSPQIAVDDPNSEARSEQPMEIHVFPLKNLQGPSSGKDANEMTSSPHVNDESEGDGLESRNSSKGDGSEIQSGNGARMRPIAETTHFVTSSAEELVVGREKGEKMGGGKGKERERDMELKSSIELTEKKKNMETSEGITLSEEPAKPGVLCSRTSYRHICLSGMPSQFVYRWELLDGKCQSFPYGYCYAEFNHGHPRSHDECQEYCMNEKEDLNTEILARLL